MALVEVPERVTNLARRVGPIDHRHDLALPPELRAEAQVGLIQVGDEKGELLVLERRVSDRFERRAERAEPRSASGGADDHVEAVRLQSPSVLAERAARRDIDDQVVTLAALREILARV